MQAAAPVLAARASSPGEAISNNVTTAQATFRCFIGAPSQPDARQIDRRRLSNFFKD
jgi:hypothetical protein